MNDPDDVILAGLGLVDRVLGQLGRAGHRLEDEYRSEAGEQLVRSLGRAVALDDPQPYLVGVIRNAIRTVDRRERACLRSLPSLDAMGDPEEGTSLDVAGPAADPADLADLAGRKPCPHCRELKPVGAFYGRGGGRGGVASWCKLCVRDEYEGRRRTRAFRRWQAAYLARPDVQERRKEADRRRQAKRRGKPRACNHTPRGRLLHCRRQARIRLRAATDPDRRARVEALIAQYDRELERLARQPA